jgi:hypothetical protein
MKRSTKGARLASRIGTRGQLPAERKPRYFTSATPGGFQVPAPGGGMEGGSAFGQYSRITK